MTLATLVCCVTLIALPAQAQDSDGATNQIIQVPAGWSRENAAWATLLTPNALPEGSSVQIILWSYPPSGDLRTQFEQAFTALMSGQRILKTGKLGSERTAQGVEMLARTAEVQLANASHLYHYCVAAATPSSFDVLLYSANSPELFDRYARDLKQLIATRQFADLNPSTAVPPAGAVDTQRNPGSIGGAAQTHVLRYTPPANAFKSSVQADDFSLNGTNASVQIYQFRPFNGDIVQTFQRTLLRDWIGPMHQEENVGGQPTFQRVTVAGADAAIAATFNEYRVGGLPHPHNRILIVKGNEAAIVDASAGTVQGWQMALPRLSEMASTLKVEGAPAAAPLSIEAGNRIAGLYQGMKAKYTAAMMNITGAGSYQTALHFYVFSGNGRVYRAYDKLEAPGGRFDFDAAERRDPRNSGSYTVDGGKLVIKMRGENEPIVTDPPKDGVLTIYQVAYKKQ